MEREPDAWADARRWVAPGILAVLVGCAGTHEARTARDLDQLAPELRGQAAPQDSQAEFDGSLEDYLAYAMGHSPGLRASFERWRAATLRISRARRLPEPTLSYGYYIESVQTRVGPQRHRISLSQSFPWPTRLSAGADAASAVARAAQRRFDAQVLVLKRRVADAYWRLWLSLRLHRLMTEHDLVLEALVGTVRARVEVGQASLADLQQLHVDVTRHHDHRGQHLADVRALAAALRAVVGAPQVTDTPTTAAAPAGGVPRETEAALREATLAHPAIEAPSLMAEASDARARVEGADRFPRFTLGATYIETGEAAGAQGSGTDAIIGTVGLSLPLWQGSYSDAVDAAEAEGAAFRADTEHARLRAVAALSAALATVRDADRRIHLYADTLIPQGEVAYVSVVGGYQTGRSSMAATLLAQRDLLGLQLALARARVDHARALAHLEEVVGRSMALQERTQTPASSTEESDDG